MTKAAFVRIWRRPELNDYLVIVIGQDGGLLEWRPYSYDGEIGKIIAEADAQQDAEDLGRQYNCPVKEIG